ncbi:adenosylhomocysteine nucleosidase [Robbsia andropogonis]|uniref:5'-methylthioadenosine/adenosylhomocysteine nucleosidase n=1 Tax=Robbsia andropogonis TaxID=28092 RepID=UPI003D246CA5
MPASLAPSSSLSDMTSTLAAEAQSHHAPVSRDAGPIGVIGALPEEIAGLLARLSSYGVTLGGRDFHRGYVAGVDCVAVLSRIGKVAAATTASVLIHRFGVRAIVFVGVAGGIGDAVRVGDIVIGEGFVQHDMDASPLFPRFEVPLSGVSRHAADAHWSAALRRAAQTYLASRRGRPGEAQPRVHCGLIGSGDRFVSGLNERILLSEAIPGLLAVDMESAAVAQVCHEHDVPFAAMRSISDSADDGAAIDFPVFLHEVAAVYADGVLDTLFAQVSSAHDPAASCNVAAG